MKIKYNRFIKAVGIEFEGLYLPGILKEIEKKGFIEEVKYDGSLHSISEDEEGYEAREVITTPASTSSRLNEILEYFDKLYKNEQYRLNRTCGLHYHISVKDEVFGALCSLEFFKSYIVTFNKVAPDVFEERKNNYYCNFFLENVYGRSSNGQIKLTPRILNKHFGLQSAIRYLAINYCYLKHKTIEFRGYGGEHATIKGLAEIINATINLIGLFGKHGGVYKKRFFMEENSQPVRYEIDFEREENFYKLLTF